MQGVLLCLFVFLIPSAWKLRSQGDTDINKTRWYLDTLELNKRNWTWAALLIHGISLSRYLSFEEAWDVPCVGGENSGGLWCRAMVREGWREAFAPKLSYQGGFALLLSQRHFEIKLMVSRRPRLRVFIEWQIQEALTKLNQSEGRLKGCHQLGERLQGSGGEQPDALCL